VWVGLVDEDPKLTFTKVCLLVTHRNSDQFKLPIVKALLRGFEIAYAADSETLGEAVGNHERTMPHG
jgi:hypothetical protein